MNLNGLREAMAVYRLDVPTLEPKKAFFIGCCPLASVADAQDAWTYETFAKTMADRSAPLKLVILAIVETRDEAEQIQKVTAALEGVWINLHDQRCEPPLTRGSRGTPVRDVSSGMRYETASHAAKAIGCTVGAMSQHLNGRLAHIRGRRFERVPA